MTDPIEDTRITGLVEQTSLNSGDTFVLDNIGLTKARSISAANLAAALGGLSPHIWIPQNPPIDGGWKITLVEPQTPPTLDWQMVDFAPLGVPDNAILVLLVVSAVDISNTGNQMLITARPYGVADAQGDIVLIGTDSHQKGFFVMPMVDRKIEYNLFGTPPASAQVDVYISLIGAILQ